MALCDSCAVATWPKWAEPFSDWSWLKEESVNLPNMNSPSRALWQHKCTNQLERPPGTPLTSHPRLSFFLLSSYFFFFSMIILQSLLKFKKDWKSGTPVVAGNGRVVCVVVATKPGSCTNARPVRGHFNTSVSSVWRKNANRTSDPGLLLWVCVFFFFAFVCSCRKNIF